MCKFRESLNSGGNGPIPDDFQIFGGRQSIKTPSPLPSFCKKTGSRLPESIVWQQRQNRPGYGRPESLGPAFDTGDIQRFDPFVKEFSAVLKDHFNEDRFDFLINNAGIGHYALFENNTEEAFDRIMNINLKGVFFLTQKLLPLINDGGRIINLSSGLARFTIPGNSVYAAMKGAIETLTRYLAVELGPRRIAVNTLAPGAIETDFNGGAVTTIRSIIKWLPTAPPSAASGCPTISVA